MTIESDELEFGDGESPTIRSLFPLSQFKLKDPCKGRKCLIKSMCTRWCDDKYKNQTFKDHMWEVKQSYRAFAKKSTYPVWIFVRFVMEVALLCGAAAICAGFLFGIFMGVVWTVTTLIYYIGRFNT